MIWTSVAAPLRTNARMSTLVKTAKAVLARGEKSLVETASAIWLLDFRLVGKGRPPGPTIACTVILSPFFGLLTTPNCNTMSTRAIFVGRRKTYGDEEEDECQENYGRVEGSGVVEDVV